MVLFIVGTVVFSLVTIGLAVSIALWVYEDAKVKSDQSPVLWLLVVLFASLIGIILYLAVGRTNKDAQAPGKYKKLMIALAVCLIFATGLFVVGIVRYVQDGGGSISSGTFSMQRSRVSNNVWTYTARSANGWERRSPNLSAEQLSAFHVLSDSGDGLRLRLEQGDLVEVFDISGFFDELIDMSSFEAGRVRITLQFDRARDVDVRISWRE